MIIFLLLLSGQKYFSLIISNNISYASFQRDRWTRARLRYFYIVYVIETYAWLFCC